MRGSKEEVSGKETTSESPFSIRKEDPLRQIYSTVVQYSSRCTVSLIGLNIAESHCLSRMKRYIQKLSCLFSINYTQYFTDQKRVFKSRF